MTQQNQTAPQYKYHKSVRWICWAMTAIAAVVLAIMMFLSVADVIATQFMHPIEGAVEITALLVVVVGCLGLGYAQLTKSNISIDIIPNRFSTTGKAILDIFSYLMSVGLCALLVWQMSLRSWAYIFKTLGGKTVTLHITLWPFMALMTICFAWLMVIYIIDLVNAFKEVSKR